MTKAELESALATLETLIQIFAILVAVGIVGEVGFGVRHWIFNRRLQALQHIEDVQQQAERSQLNQQAGNANKEAGIARRDAGAAIERAEALRLDIATSSERAAKAEQHAAEANLELARLRDPRNLLPEQQDRVIAALRKFPGQKFSFSVYPDPEPLALLRVIDALLKSASWERVPSQMGALTVEASGSTAGTAYDSGVDALIAPDDGNSKPALLALGRPSPRRAYFAHRIPTMD